MQKAADSVRLAIAYEAITTWVRLKSVEMALGDYTTQHTELLARCREAEIALCYCPDKDANTTTYRSSFCITGSIGSDSGLPMASCIRSFCYFPERSHRHLAMVFSH